jgi:hypothetical protein
VALLWLNTCLHMPMNYYYLIIFPSCNNKTIFFSSYIVIEGHMTNGINYYDQKILLMEKATSIILLQM